MHRFSNRRDHPSLRQALPDSSSSAASIRRPSIRITIRIPRAPQYRQLHMPLRDRLLQDIYIILPFPLPFPFSANGVPLMHTTKAKPVLRAVARSLVDEKEERVLERVGFLVDLAAVADVPADGAGGVGYLVEGRGLGHLLEHCVEREA